MIKDGDKCVFIGCSDRRDSSCTGPSSSCFDALACTNLFDKIGTLVNAGSIWYFVSDDEGDTISINYDWVRPLTPIEQLADEVTDGIS